MDPAAREGWAASRPTKDHAVDAACVAPWVSIEFDPAGIVYACCTSGLYPLGRIGEQRLTELWGGPRARVLREALSRWDLTVACGPCRWHLHHGRMDPVAAVYDQYPVREPDPEFPFMMLFALSNRCNLGCVMCTPELSTTLRAEAGLPALASPYDDAFFEDLEPLLAHLQLAKFLGGEPFLAPEHKRVWEMMDRLERPPRMQVTTNGTVWTPYVAWLLERFEMDISVSVDAATGPTYAKVRRGGDFDQLMANVDRFAATCRQRGTEFHVSYCLMNENHHELAAFLRWADRFDIPASINLVTDVGLALHDEDLSTLHRVRARWDEEDRAIGDGFGKNRPVWETQLAQLDSVIAEREAGIAPAPRQAQRVDASVFSAAEPSVHDHGGSTIPAHRARLAAWGTGEVAELTYDAQGTIRAVPSEHARLGLTAERLLGRSLLDVLATMEVAVGAPGWIVDLAEMPDHLVRTLVLANEPPVRGASGVIVRTIQVGAADGGALLLAEDRFYDRSEPAWSGSAEAPVTIGARPRPS